jgi:hypothetical protein
MRIAIHIIVAAAVAITALPLLAQDYFPLETGLTWRYTGSADSELVSTVLGPVDWDGLTVVELKHVETGPGAQEYHNFWIRDDDGRTWLHGAWNASGFGAIYDPPILYIDATLALGHSWITEFGLDGTLYELTYAVFEAGETTVPLGVLFAYGIGAVEPPRIGENAAYDLLGRRLDGASREASRWYSEGIGLIRTFEGLELAEFSGSVAYEVATWSGIKALFTP